MRLSPAPFEVNRNKKLAEYAGRTVLFEDVNYDKWKALSASKQLPVGAVWVACLGTVYGPKVAA